MKVYLAGPIFSKAEQAWLSDVRIQILSLGHSMDVPIDVIWVFEITEKLRKDGISDDVLRSQILRLCTEGLDRADLLIAVLDGSQIDDGTAWEIGYFFARKGLQQKIIGIRTDFRNRGDTKSSLINTLIETSCTKIVTNVEGLVQEIRQATTHYVR